MQVEEIERWLGYLWLWAPSGIDLGIRYDIQLGNGSPGTVTRVVQLACALVEL